MPKLKDGFKGERWIVLPSSVVKKIKEDEFGKELYITDIGYYPQAAFHFRQRIKEEARQYILIYCISGEGWFKLGKNTYTVTENQCFILPKNMEHSYGSSTNAPWTIYWIHFNGVKAPFFADGFNKPTEISTNYSSRIEDRLRVFEEIFHTLRQGYSQANLYYAINCLFYFLGSIKFMGEYRKSLSYNKEEDIIDKAIHYMQENIEKRITLQDIATYVGLSPSHFSSLFTKTGYSPLKYLTDLRIQKACHYLDFSDLKVNQICHKFGFNDPFYFTRIFTKIMGVSPTKYKLQKKG